MPRSASYSCNILTSAQEAVATIPVEAKTDADADAVLKGSTLGHEQPDYAGYEIRDGDRPVFMRAFGTDAKR